MEERKQSRTVNTVLNVIINAICQITNYAVSFLIPPLLINTYGSVVNGLITTVKQVISYLSLVGAGISESTIVSLYKPLHEEDCLKISAIYNAIGKTFNRAGWVFSTLSVILAFILPLIKKDGMPYYFITCMVLILSIGGASEFFVAGKYRALITADQKVFVVNIAQTVGTVVGAALTILFVRLKVNVLIVQSIATITYVLRICLLFVYVRRRYYYLDKKIIPDYSAISRRRAATVHQMSYMVIFGSQPIFISYFCGFKEASVYSIYSMIFSGIMTLLNTFSSAVIASVGNLMEEDDVNHLRMVYKVFEYLFFTATYACFATALSMINSFLELYVGNISDTQYIRKELIVLFVCMGLMNCIRSPGLTMINAKGHYKETQTRALLEMGICIVGQLFLALPFGIVGVLIATILAFLYRTTDIIAYSHHRILLDSIKPTLGRLLVNTIPLIAIGYLSSRLSIIASNYMIWIVFASATFVVTTIVFGIIGYLYDVNTGKTAYKYSKNIFKSFHR